MENRYAMMISTTLDVADFELWLLRTRVNDEILLGVGI
jgi:hypothetical protein